MSTLATLAQYHMDSGDHMDGGWGWAMFTAMLLLVLAVIALVAWLIRTTGLRHHHAGGSAVAETPRQILDRRLAAGELTPEEHRERAGMLGS